MFKFIPYVFKSLWRHRARTLLTVSGTAVALLVFCFIGAVQQGFPSLDHSIHGHGGHHCRLSVQEGHRHLQ